MDGSSRWILPAIAIALLPAAAAAQERSLGAPTARVPESFDMVAGVRELPDGRVVVSDGIAETVMVVNVATGRREQLSRRGSGPGEYKLPDALFPLPGGRTLLLDLGNGRMTTIEADLTFGESRSMASDGPAGFSIVMPRATDDRGRVYHQPEGRPLGDGMPDSAAVVRLDLATETGDTAAMVKLAAVDVETSGGPNDRSVMARPIPFSAQDAWDVAPDGSVAVARAGTEYRLDWYRPSGRVVRGPTIPVRPVQVREADKREWLDALSGGLSVMVMMENGQRSVSFGRGGRGSGPDPADFQWPEIKPPFPGNAVLVTPEGDAWVRRYVAAGEPIRYDIFGPDGARTERVTLPVGRRVVAFGRGVAYAVETDEDGLQWLERYRR